MRRKGRLPELLCPAGNMECLYAAVAAGADAVYVGGVRFGARAYAKNFDIDELRSAVSYCHLHGVKLYVTLNTLIEDVEMSDALAYARELYRIGVDALIVADLGVLREVRRALPEFELHASTQMSVHSTAGAEAAASLGCSRVVPARELSRRDIVALVEGCSVEVEVFLHGALCVCHSGQCLFSSLVGGRSGNRGECAQPCRLPYGDGYPLSLSDLSLADHIPELIESGVASLKIEGRMKSAAYVWSVTAVYRRLLDEGRSANAEEHELLRRAFSRGGFTDGYFVGRIGDPSMLGVRSEEDKRESRELRDGASGTVSELSAVLDRNGKFAAIRVPVKAAATIKRGEPARLTLTLGERSVTVLGDEPEAAENAPLTDSAVRERLAKMGNTMLSLEPSDVELTLDDGVNLSPASLNALRRAAAEKMQDFSRHDSIEDAFCGMKTPTRVANSAIGRYTAEFFSTEAYLEARRARPDLFERLSYAFLPLMEYGEGGFSAEAVSLPVVITDSELMRVRELLRKAADDGVRYALVHNIGATLLVREYGMIPVASYRLNVSNSHSREVLSELGVGGFISSAELTLPKARDVGGSLVTLGRIPLMITERCFMKDNFGCSRCGKGAFVDRRGESFPVVREWDHRNIILNSALTYMGDRREELSRYKISGEHFIFTVERGEEINELLEAYFGGKALPPRFGNARRIGRRSPTTEPDSRSRAADSALVKGEQKPTAKKGEDKFQPRKGEYKAQKNRPFSDGRPERRNARDTRSEGYGGKAQKNKPNDFRAKNGKGEKRPNNGRKR